MTSCAYKKVRFCDSFYMNLEHIVSEMVSRRE